MFDNAEEAIELQRREHDARKTQLETDVTAIDAIIDGLCSEFFDGVTTRGLAPRRDPSISREPGWGVKARIKSWDFVTIFITVRGDWWVWSDRSNSFHRSVSGVSRGPLDPGVSISEVRKELEGSFAHAARELVSPS